MSEHKLTTKRIDSSFYRLTYRGVSFTASTLERHTDGESMDRLWILFEETDGDWDGYWNHFCTLWECKKAVIGGMNDRLGED